MYSISREIHESSDTNIAYLYICNADFASKEQVDLARSRRGSHPSGQRCLCMKRSSACMCGPVAILDVAQRQLG